MSTPQGKAKARATWRRRYYRLKANGACTKCGTPAEQVLCPACREKHEARYVQVCAGGLKFYYPLPKGLDKGEVKASLAEFRANQTEEYKEVSSGWIG